MRKTKQFQSEDFDICIKLTIKYLTHQCKGSKTFFISIFSVGFPTLNNEILVHYPADWPASSNFKTSRALGAVSKSVSKVFIYNY